MSTPEALRWGILGTGTMARRIARALTQTDSGTLQAVGSRAYASAQVFALEYSVPEFYDNYAAVLQDERVEAVYIALPNADHARWAIAAAQAGKHVLCEKPLGTSPDEVESILAAARDAGTFLMEAYMYRCHAQTLRLVELLREEAIGKLRYIRAAFAFDYLPEPEHRLRSPELGGGALLDVGGYPLSMARLIAGVASGAEASFVQPESLAAIGLQDPETPVEQSALACAVFPGQVLAQLECGYGYQQHMRVEVIGQTGRIDLSDPWFCNGTLTLSRFNEPQPQVEGFKDRPSPYVAELEAAAQAIRAGNSQAVAPGMTWEDSLGNAQALENWHQRLQA